MVTSGRKLHVIKLPRVICKLFIVLCLSSIAAPGLAQFNKSLEGTYHNRIIKEDIIVIDHNKLLICYADTKDTIAVFRYRVINDSILEIFNSHPYETVKQSTVIQSHNNNSDSISISLTIPDKTPLRLTLRDNHNDTLNIITNDGFAYLSFSDSLFKDSIFIDLEPINLLYVSDVDYYYEGITHLNEIVGIPFSTGYHYSIFLPGIKEGFWRAPYIPSYYIRYYKNYIFWGSKIFIKY